MHWLVWFCESRCCITQLDLTSTCCSMNLADNTGIEWIEFLCGDLHNMKLNFIDLMRELLRVSAWLAHQKRSLWKTVTCCMKVCFCSVNFIAHLSHIWRFTIGVQLLMKLCVSISILSNTGLFLAQIFKSITQFCRRETLDLTVLVDNNRTVSLSDCWTRVQPCPDLIRNMRSDHARWK